MAKIKEGKVKYWDASSSLTGDNITVFTNIFYKYLNANKICENSSDCKNTESERKAILLKNGDVMNVFVNFKNCDMNIYRNREACGSLWYITDNKGLVECGKNLSVFGLQKTEFSPWDLKKRKTAGITMISALKVPVIPMRREVINIGNVPLG